tara:strand:- start:1978 stop:2883 length:906 start_codon:yes stop_codon:yes gene_type:complete
MSKDENKFNFEVEEKGKSVDRAFSITEVTLQQQNEATKVYNRAFRDALESGALLRNKLEDYMRNQGLWNDEKQADLELLQKEILDKEKQLAKGGIRLSVAKDTAMEMSEKRVEIRTMLMERNSLDGSTAEGQADNAKFDYLVSASLVYNDSNKPYFKDLADYRNRNTEPVALEAAKRCAQKLYGLDSNHEHNLAENKFLKEFSFIDEDLRLINNDGKLVDREGNLVNEDGRYIDEDGNLVDVDGNPVTVEGEYDFERQPFLNEDGKPIESKETDSEPEPEEEAKVEDTGDEVEAEAEADDD